MIEASKSTSKVTGFSSKFGSISINFYLFKTAIIFISNSSNFPFSC